MLLAMDTPELKYWVAFNRVPQIGRARFALLERHFGSLERAWGAGLSELGQGGLDPRSARLIVEHRDGIDPDRELSQLESAGVRPVTWHDPEYPPRLKETHDLPPVLYVKGHLLAEDERSVAVVGTRKATAYGRQVAHRLSYDLSMAGVTVVSGLARGIDAIAHRAALDAGRRTIAVMGNGPDVMYPREHAKLADEIAQNGALVTEHPLGVRPDSRNFPRRNRIMSGMTLGTLVIEAGEGSGALITARHALEQDREVFAVPGDIRVPTSRSTNDLVKRGGAKLVSQVQDILEELNLSAVGDQAGPPQAAEQIEMKALFPMDEHESDVLRWVTYEPVHIDEVVRQSNLTASEVSSTLAMMELQGYVEQVGGMHYVRLKESAHEYEAAR